MQKPIFPSIFSVALGSVAMLVSAPSYALADVLLELRPAAQSVVAGQQVEVEVYAVADPAEPVGIVHIVLSWDASSIMLTGSDGTGAHPWAAAIFPGGGLNTSYLDGDAFFIAQVSPCSAATASPAGLLVTTLIFDATGSPGTSTVDILQSLGGFDTKVWDNLILFGCGGVLVPSLIGQSADVTIICSADGECDDGIGCTNDICTNDFCEHQDTCVDDNIFCNGTEFCNLSAGFCDRTGDPCPGECNELDQCPSCEPPLVESVGPRYIAITPQPVANSAPTAFLVTSSDWPCLSKYVGTFARCGGTGGFCTNDADCNSCTLLNTACLSDDDCKTCQGSTNPCQGSGDCGGDPCETVQVCELSGQTCEQSPLEEIDIDKDGLPDGILATLVDDPANRAIFTAEEWGTTTYPRCSFSQDACLTNADCDIGVCSFSGRGCSVSADDCRGLCAIAQTECHGDVECPTPGDACTGSQACVTFETCQAGKIFVMSSDIVPTDIDKVTGTLFPISYSIQADCGSLSDPVSVVMRLWADSDDNGLVNINDTGLMILGFQGRYLPTVPSRTTVAFDIEGQACTPNQTVSINDVFLAILAFQGARFDPDVVGSSSDCSLPCP
ncbi:MAG: hypothetical protein IH987_00830 [Planctomycetes bacterium]|nr:hypothetical protein [Planctomycetota bacterium]